MTDNTEKDLAGPLLNNLHKKAGGLGNVRIMEVCGTHTMEIGRLGLRSLLPQNIELVSGPGCPVCVTPASVIDNACELSLRPKHTILTFGDMIRVPGDQMSLEKAKSKGGNVLTLFSPLQSIEIAKKNPSETFIFIAIGFETTQPVIARTIYLTAEQNINNLFFLPAHRTVPNAVSALIADPSIQIDGFLLPGHVCTITGIDVFKNILKQKIPAVVTGFEPLDIILGIMTIIDMLTTFRFDVINRYTKAVSNDGNKSAVDLINSVFTPCDSIWRGIGVIPQSGLTLRNYYCTYDASRVFLLSNELHENTSKCSCGDVLKGKIRPPQCPLFKNVCTPETPMGPCMVSSEGSCAAYYKYGE
jgi:hydrogenase expression/formation protein HypD